MASGDETPDGWLPTGKPTTPFADTDGMKQSDNKATMNKRLTLFMDQTFLQPQTDWGFKVNIQDNNSCAGGGSASTAIATANVAKTIDNCKRNAVFRSKNDEFLRFSAIM